MRFYDGICNDKHLITMILFNKLNFILAVLHDLSSMTSFKTCCSICCVVQSDNLIFAQRPQRFDSAIKICFFASLHLSLSLTHLCLQFAAREDFCW